MRVAARPSQPTVFVVEADASIRNSLARLMRLEGFTVRFYENAELFLDDDVPAPAGCLLIDINLSKPNGLELRRRLAERASHIPMIAVSGRDDDAIRTEAREIGAIFFFRKPVDDRTLIDAIEWALTRGSVRKTE